VHKGSINSRPVTLRSAARSACRGAVIAPIPQLFQEHGGLGMATFNRIFSTQRLLQIVVILGATLIMKLLS
jgi:hypothetical protein